MTGTCGRKSSFMYSDGLIEVKESTIDGFGIFAMTKLIRDQPIAYFDGYEIDHDTRYSLVLKDNLKDKRIEPTGLLKYLNHSCAPNAHFRGRWLFALRDISPNEEITIDYIANEGMISYHFKCNCGAENCRGWI